MRSGSPFQVARDRALPGLTPRDRRLAYALAAGVLRRQAVLDRRLALGVADPRLHDVLRLGAFQLGALARVPAYAAVATSVALAREVAGERAARYVNHALRRLAAAEPDPAPDRGEGVRTHPRWLVERWRRQFGAQATGGLVSWNDARPSVVLQPARWDVATLRRAFQAAGIGVQEAPFGAGLVVVPGGGGWGGSSSALPPIAQWPGYREGGFIVQDPAHALVCRYAALPPGTCVYDACAAPGGKAVMLEQAGARVVAGDPDRARIARLAATVRRAGVAIRIAAADLLSAPYAWGAFAAVVVDAPCSGTGTMGRHPDARWRLRPGTIARAATRQQALVAAAARLVGPRGLLVYATCSLEPEENRDLVNAFLAAHPEFARAPVPGAVPAALVSAEGDFQSLPQRDGVDGAYAARLRRTG